MLVINKDLTCLARSTCWAFPAISKSLSQRCYPLNARQATGNSLAEWSNIGFAAPQSKLKHYLGVSPVCPKCTRTKVYFWPTSFVVVTYARLPMWLVRRCYHSKVRLPIIKFPLTKGTFAGNPLLDAEKNWFPLDFPFNQFVISLIQYPWRIHVW